MKKNRTLLIIVISLFVLLVIVIIIPESPSSNPTKNNPEKPWDSMTYEEHEAWINNYMDNPNKDGYQMLSVTKDAIKKYLSHPETVEFKISPTFDSAIRNVVEADSGWVFSYGKGTAKNSFGVPIGFTYSVKWKITPNDLKILDISVSQDK